MIRCCESPSNEISAELEKGERKVSWPRLKALYLEGVDRHWLEKLPKFRELRILRLRNLESRLPDFVKNAAENIAKCQLLRVIDVEFREVNDAEIILDMARGCPLLQRFRVDTGDPTGTELTGNQFSRLLQALPHLELLSLKIEFQMGASKLGDLANYCPRLTVLDLFRTRMCLSLESLAVAPPLQRLELMYVREVKFNNPRCFMRLNRLRSIAREWGRVFPRIRELPCGADVYGPAVDLEDCSWSEEPEDDGISGGPDDHDMTLNSPGLESGDYGSDSFNLRRRLWRLLGYGTDTEVFNKVYHMWQTNLEIKTLGWPVLPIAAFLDPDSHSTADRHKRWVD